MSEDGLDPPGDLPEEAEPAKPGQSLARLAWRRFRRNRLAFGGLVFLVIIVLLSAFAPWVARTDPVSLNLRAILQAPSGDHWLGTDQVGRDVLARVLYGGRISLAIGGAAAVSTVFAGMILGLLAGYRGGVIDWIIMRAVEVILSFPTLVLIIFFVTRFGQNARSIVLVVVLFQWPLSCRLVRNMTMSIREVDFVQSAKGFGAGGFHTTVKHILPAAIGPLTVAGTLLAATSILLESALSFLGFGISPPTATWGGILTEAQSLTVLEQTPWLWIPPGLLIALTVLSINFVGDGLRDALDPRTREFT
jgi:peptide/nickel transport system permease protein